MYLRYLESAPQSEALRLDNKQGWCVELYILRNDDDSHSLVALSGRPQIQARRVKIQGPYQMRAQALAARSAIAAQLEVTGFSVSQHASPQWRLQAQREIRAVRELRKQNTPDCSFDPKDVY